jgi:hypothetical protein
LPQSITLQKNSQKLKKQPWMFYTKLTTSIQQNKQTTKLQKN